MIKEFAKNRLLANNKKILSYQLYFLNLHKNNSMIIPKYKGMLIPLKLQSRFKKRTGLHKKDWIQFKINGLILKREKEIIPKSKKLIKTKEKLIRVLKYHLYKAFYMNMYIKYDK